MRERERERGDFLLLNRETCRQVSNSHIPAIGVLRSLSQSTELLSHTETDKGGPLPSSVPMCPFDLGVKYANRNSFSPRLFQTHDRDCLAYFFLCTYSIDSERASVGFLDKV